MSVPLPSSGRWSSRQRPRLYHLIESCSTSGRPSAPAHAQFQHSRREVLASTCWALATLPASAGAAPLPGRLQISVNYDRFAKEYDNLDDGIVARTFGFPSLRQDVVGQAAGNVLETGAGTGMSQVSCCSLYALQSTARLLTSTGIPATAAVAPPQNAFGRCFHICAPPSHAKCLCSSTVRPRPSTHGHVMSGAVSELAIQGAES
jgi:hypothetical protein